jgi:hypothetical protein
MKWFCNPCWKDLRVMLETNNHCGLIDCPLNGNKCIRKLFGKKNIIIWKWVKKLKSGASLRWTARWRHQVDHNWPVLYLGGTLGLFVGVSLMSFIEIVIWDRFYETPFVPKTFRINFNTHILDKFPPKKHK